jgi:hypothetical protein
LTIAPGGLSGWIRIGDKNITLAGLGDFRISADVLAGTYTRIFTATQAQHFVFAQNSSGTNGQWAEFDNFSVRELNGSHAIQATTANKPTLRRTASGRHWLQADSNDVMNITFASAPGVVELGRLNQSGAMVWTTPTLGTTWNMIAEGFNGLTLMRKTPFTDREKALISHYAARQAPLPGEIVL